MSSDNYVYKPRKTPAPIAIQSSPARILRYLIWLVALVLVVWAFIDPRFRTVDGFVAGSVCLPLSAGIALLLAGWCVGRRWLQAGLWAGAGSIGQATALQLINAGPTLHYQHYTPVTQLLSETQPLLLAVMAAYTLIVCAGLVLHRHTLSAWFGTRLNRWQLVGIALILTATSATVSHDLPVYLSELVLASIIQFVNLGAVVLAVLALPSDAVAGVNHRLHTLFDETPDTPVNRRRVDRFVLVVAVWVFCLSAFLAVVSYERHPHITDEVAYILQARYFAAGTLSMPAPPVEEAFDFYLMQFAGDRWYASPPPGWPAMLAVGVRLGIPWLINPLLAAFNIVLIYILIGDLYSRRAARIAVLLLGLSPWYLFMSMNIMTHTFTLTCALVAVVGVMHARATHSALWAWIAGAVLGVSSLIRPLDGLIAALVVGVWAIGIGGRRLKFTSLVGLVGGAMVVGALVLPYNAALTGDPLLFPIMEYTNQRFGPGANAYGFGPDRGMGWPIDPNLGHTPVDALINTNLNAFSLNIELFGWGAGSLLLVAVWLVSGTYRRSDFLMVGVIGAVFTAYFFYYFSGGPDFGARYWYLMIVPLAALTVRGLAYLEARSSASGHDSRILIAVLLLSLFAFVNVVPWRAIDKYHHYLGMRPDIRQLAIDYDFGRSVVLIRGDEHPDYSSAAVYNPLAPYADAPIYVRDRSPQVTDRVLEAYSDRPVWVVDGPTVTGAGYAVIAGPLAPGTLPSQ